MILKSVKSLLAYLVVTGFMTAVVAFVSFSSPYIRILCTNYKTYLSVLRDHISQDLCENTANSKTYLVVILLPIY